MVVMLLASDFDQSKYFKAEDFEGEKKMKIREGTEELVGENKERKLIVWFTNDSHGLPLNRTNNRTLRGAFGDAVENWKGRIIVLYRTEAEYKGRLVPALRIRIPVPKATITTGGPKQPPLAEPLENTLSAPAKPPKPAVQSLEEDLDDEIAF
jgi:hypothetical protein